MDKRMNYIGADMKLWLVELINSSEVDFFFLHKVKDTVFENFGIKISDIHQGRSSPLTKNQGYFTFSDKDRVIVKREILEFVENAIAKKEYTTQGLANYFILIDRLGSMTENDHHEMSLIYASYISNEDYHSMVVELISCFNNNYKFSTEIKSELNFKEWEDLFFSIQYLDRLHNPIGVLRRAIKFKFDTLPILKLIDLIKPDPKAALFEYGLSLDSFSEAEIVMHLSQNLTQIPFYTCLILDEHSSSPTFLGGTLAKYLVEDNWKISGKEINRKVFGGTRKTINEETKGIFQRTMEEFFVKQFSLEEGNAEILLEFEWPEDHLALGGWLAKINSRETPFNLNTGFVEYLTISYSNYLVALKENLPSYINGNLNSYNMWFADVFDLRAQYSTGYVLWAITLCTEKTYNAFADNFLKLAYEVKELYYGSYEASSLARKISNFLYCFIFSYPKDVSVDRINQLLKILNNNLIHPWVILTERDKMFWGMKNDSLNHLNPEIVFLFRRFISVPELYVPLVASFKSEINKHSTINWSFNE